MQQRQIVTGEPPTLRDFVERTIVFGCMPALVLSLILWPIATTALTQAGPLPTTIALLATVLLSFISLVLLVRYVDRVAENIRIYTADPTMRDSEWLLAFSIWGIVLSICLAIGTGVCLYRAGTFGIEHVLLLIAEIPLLGFQIWRIFRR
jgi:uncharacterized membrane protein